MNKIIVPDVDNAEYTGTITALVRNQYVVHCVRIAVQKYDLKGAAYTEYERWIYYCPICLMSDFLELINEYEDKNE